MIKVGTDYSGIGAPEQALKQMKIEHEVEFACEKDEFARKSYLANHSCKIMYPDVTLRNNKKAPYVDLYFFGFPCQAFSISGKRQGFEDIRGTLFFNSADYIKEQRPKVFVAENVKGLLSHDKVKGSKSKYGRTFNTIINLLAKTVNGQILMPMYEDNLGYNIFFKVLDSKHYDVPQSRQRVFIIGFRDDVVYNFPAKNTVTKSLADILEKNVDDKYYLSERMIDYFNTRGKNFNQGKINYKSKNDIANTITATSYMLDISDNIIIEGECTPNSQSGKVYSVNGIMPTLISGTHGYALGYINDKKVIQINNCKESNNTQPYQQNRIYDINGISPALVSQMSSGSHAVYINKKTIRRLTPLECFRLQAFPDEFYYNIKYESEEYSKIFLEKKQIIKKTVIFNNQQRVERMSDTQLYKQSGNSMTVTVLMAILANIQKIGQL